MRNPLIIGTRGSDLALWQANHVQSILASKGIETTIHIIKTTGDQIQNLSFDKIEGKGFFTKEIEEALLNNTCAHTIYFLYSFLLSKKLSNIYYIV